MRRITLTLTDDEKDALTTLARAEFRDSQRQAALIIRQELERRGLLPQPREVATAAEEEEAEEAA